MRLVCLCALVLSSVGVASDSERSARPSAAFSVAADVALKQFASPAAGADRVSFSPDRKLFLVKIDGADRDLNHPESTICVFRVRDVLNALASPRGARPEPLWSLSSSESFNGPAIDDVRWLRDSSGFAYLAQNVEGRQQLFLASLATKQTTLLTPPGALSVTGYDIVDKDNFVYSVQSARIHALQASQESREARAVTGLALSAIIFPGLYTKVFDLSELWAVVNGRRLRVSRLSDGKPVDLNLAGSRTLALSPDGRRLVTIVRRERVPQTWIERYYAADPSTAALAERSAARASGSLEAVDAISEYVLIELSSGSIISLTDTPVAPGVRWPHREFASWSPDGATVLLSNTFVQVDSAPAKSRSPCIAVVNPANREAACVRALAGLTKAGLDPDYRFATAGYFSDDRSVELRFAGLGANSFSAERFVRQRSGTWSRAARSEAGRASAPVRVDVSEALNSPPMLVATDARTSAHRVILDPNPQLADVLIGEAAPYDWADDIGRQWHGILYLPPAYERGKRYPLVIQTHGIVKDRFVPSGLYPVNFAARELAGAGIVVLQLQDCLARAMDEAPCQVAGYKAAIERLTSDGIIDADRVGIAGFSRTCSYVLAALTSHAIRFRAASIADGITHSYFEYLLTVDQLGNIVAQDAEQAIGARPFGDGLHEWFERSPAFNMDKVDAPLQIIAAQGPASLIATWEPYAALRMLTKPVDLLYLSEPGTHPLTNPSQRLFTQQGAVDWFRYWLQGYEDADPRKAEQYRRWRELRALPGVH